MKTIIAFLTFFAASLSLAQLAPQKLIVPEKFKSVFATDRMLSIDPQYEISVFYAGSPLTRPRFMAFNEKQVLHTADLFGGAVFALPDLNKDGIADTAIAVTPHVDSVHSIAFYKGTLYVAEPSKIRRFQDKDGDGFYETELAPFYAGIPASGPYNHFTRTILIDSVKKYLYVSVGASCNACRESSPDRAVILRFDLEGSGGAGKKVYATGFRNAIGLALHPDGSLWATNADRDGLGDSIPQEMITQVKEDGFYGWPFAYGDKNWNDFNANAEYQAMLPITNVDSARVSSMYAADVYIPAHSTPMGILFYHDPRVYIQAPPITGFVAVHGSSPNGKKVGLGYHVIKIEYDKLSTKWNVSTFLEGFLTDSVNYKYWSRPCGIIQDTSGYDMFVSSDAGIGAIYRITLKEHNDTSPSKPTIRLNVSASPNPTNGSISIDLYGLYAQTATVTVCDVTGRELDVLRSRYVASDRSVIYSLDLSNEATSVYFCIIRSEAGMKIVPIHVIH